MSIELIPHRPEWRDDFERARREIIASFSSDTLIAVEHVGSTAVPHLCAKPIVDMLIGVENLHKLRDIEPALAALRFTPWHSVPDRISFERRDEFNVSTHHAHVVIHGGPHWINQIAFRNHLRVNRDARLAYDLLKKRY